MEKLDMHTKEIVNENILKLRELFPNTVVETDGTLKIDYEALKQELNEFFEGMIKVILSLFLKQA